MGLDDLSSSPNLWGCSIFRNDRRKLRSVCNHERRENLQGSQQTGSLIDQAH